MPIVSVLNCASLKVLFDPGFQRWLPAPVRLANQMPAQISQGQTMEKLPAQMTVIGISKPGGPEVLLPETRAVPSPGAGEILIKVAAAGVTAPTSRSAPVRTRRRPEPAICRALKSPAKS